jgi:U3 small nucleolar RNA-associated protein 10
VDRLYDGNTSVLEAVYSNPKLIARLVAKSDVLPALAASLLEQGLSRNILRAHLNFYCNKFVELYPEETQKVVQSLVLPNLLCTKPRAKTCAVVWETIIGSRLGQTPLFDGLNEIFEWNKDDSAKLNERLAVKFSGMCRFLVNSLWYHLIVGAENLRNSTALPAYIDGLCSHASRDSDSHARITAWLILRYLLPSLKAETRLATVCQIFGKGVLGRIIESGHSIVDGLDDDEALSKAIVSKPSSGATTSKLQLSVLMSLIQAMGWKDKKLAWFESTSSVRVPLRSLSRCR